MVRTVRTPMAQTLTLTPTLTPTTTVLKVRTVRTPVARTPAKPKASYIGSSGDESDAEGVLSDAEIRVRPRPLDRGRTINATMNKSTK
jgi:hypothetical protein